MGQNTYNKLGFNCMVEGKKEPSQVKGLIPTGLIPSFMVILGSSMACAISA